jgi:NitT/TauT family transport system substrate-binding protein
MRKRKAGLIAAVLAMLLIAVLAAGCGAEQAGQTGQQQAQEQAKKEFVYMRYLTRVDASDPLFVYWNVADELGYFAQEGIRQEVLHADGGIPAVVAGQAELTVSGADVLLDMLAKDGKLDIISIMNQTPYNHYIVAVPPDSPIKDIKDLKGKKIAIPSQGHSVNIALRSMLDYVGINPAKDVSITVIPPGSALVDAFNSKKVDAFAYHDTAIAMAENMGVEFRVLEQLGPVKKVPGPIMVATKKALSENRDNYIGYIRALLKAWLFVDNNLGAAAQIQIKKFPDLVKAGQSKEDAQKDIMRVIKVRHDREQIPDWAEPKMYGWHWKEGWDAWTELLPSIENKKDFDVTQAYTNDLIEPAWKGIDKEAVIKQAKEYKI